MTTEILPEKSPNEVLADLVIAKLKEKGFLPDGKDDEISSKLIAGTANREDWTLWVDLARAKMGKGGNDDED